MLFLQFMTRTAVIYVSIINFFFDKHYNYFKLRNCFIRMFIRRAVEMIEKKVNPSSTGKKFICCYVVKLSHFW